MSNGVKSVEKNRFSGELSKSKNDLLEKRLKGNSNQHSNKKLINKRNLQEPIPLSFSQESIWFVNQISTKKYVYNVPGAIELKGILEINALRQSINTIIWRHEALRTVIQGNEQIVIPELVLDIEVTDLTNLKDPIQRQMVDSKLKEESKREFDLEKGPLIWAHLIKLDDDKHILLLVIHHLVFDGWSMELFLKELVFCYIHYSRGQKPSLPKLDIQYGDFVVWQRRKFLNNNYLEELLHYWGEHLKGAPTSINLPYKTPRPSIQAYEGKTLHSNIGSSIKNRLENICQEQGVTMYMVLLAALKILLYKYSGQEKLVVGTPVANRHCRELTPLIGLIMNTLPIFSKVKGDVNFFDLLDELKQITLNAYSHQDLPFEKLVEKMNLTRDMSSHPLFQVMFVFQESSVIEIPNLSLNIKELDNGTSKFDLSVRIAQTNDHLNIYWEYNTSSFEVNIMEKMLTHFERLLEELSKRPDRKISDISFFSKEEEFKILETWNDTYTPLPENAFIHQLFEETTKLNKNQTAVIVEEQEVTYEELNKRANKLARYLVKTGVKPNRLVGVIMERSLDMVISLLAILKAGGAYVPIDPTSPNERIRTIVDDANLSIILSQSHIDTSFITIPKVLVDVNNSLWEFESEHNLMTKLMPDDLIYVIYTSGTTGTPKGVMNTQRGIANRIIWMQNEYKLSKDDRVLQKTPYTFDVSFWEFFWPLISGATMVVACPEGHKDPKYISKLIKAKKITTIHFVPSMLRIFMNFGGLNSCCALKRVFCSGEALTVKDVSLFYEKSTATLYNLYGPTEAGIDVTSWKCERIEKVSIMDGRVPIGKPLANTQIYILDKYLKPVAVGVKGELYIGGAQIARGYYNQSSLTDLNFIPNPFKPKSKLYKTGDLARYKPDGNIDYLGRIDDQIKIRGQRVELGEIEAAISTFDDVKQVAVTVHKQKETDLRIAAFLTTESDTNINENLLKTYLKNYMPEYMVPTKFVYLEKMPLTVSGKVNKRELPKPDFSLNGNINDYKKPVTPVELILADIWEDVLSVNKVGVSDNFFEIGGHSLLATQVVSRIEKIFRVDYPLTNFFQNPTIEGTNCILFANPIEKEKIEKISDIMMRVNELTEDQAQSMLDKKIETKEERS